MTTPDLAPAAAATAVPVARDTALVLAGLHLRLGSLALARAELETMAAAGGLDLPGRVDLAEVRWRTGDMIGAGDAAREALAGGDETVVALVVAAEAAAALGRPTEARRLAGQALGIMDGPIDPIFAGMPRSGVWPSDPVEPAPPPATLFPPDRAAANSDPDAGGPTFVLPPVDPAAAVALGAIPGPNDDAPGFWSLAEVTDEPATTDAPVFAPPMPPRGIDAAAILDAGEAALAAGDLAGAALHLGLAVRVAPSIAWTVLDVIGDPPDAGLQMVRGDAFRAIGQEDEALRAYTTAMAAASTQSAPVSAPAEHAGHEAEHHDDQAGHVDHGDPADHGDPGDTGDHSDHVDQPDQEHHEYRADQADDGDPHPEAASPQPEPQPQDGPRDDVSADDDGSTWDADGTTWHEG